jgi:DNA-binding FadR family transcriptional regulator
MPRTLRRGEIVQGSEYRMRGIHGRIIQSIGEAIIGGHYQPGALIPRESDLIAQFSASRTSVREAIKVLAAKGLVETRQRVGTKVRPEAQWNHFDPEIIAWRLIGGFNDNFIRDLIEVRQITEPAAARLAASRATLTDIGALESALRGMEASRNNPEGYARADTSFHMQVFVASHNNLLASMSFTIRQILEATFRLHQALKGPSATGIDEDIAFHRAVLEQISRGQPEAAAEAMSDVLAAAKRDLVRAHQEHERQFKPNRRAG